jgi:hypothetical protein
VGGTKPALPFKTEHTDRNVLTVRIPVKTTLKWEQRFLLRSDAHHDNPKCDQDLERRHLEEAKACKAGVLDFGDLFDAMQGKGDRRATKAALRAELRRDAYFDALVSTAADFYEPYAHNFLMIGRGNHETSVTQKIEIDMTERLVGVLNNRAGSRIQAGGYTGWVRFMFSRNGGDRKSRILWYTHGSGGGGPVTQDITSSHRQRAYINADMIVSGHSHDAWYSEVVERGLSSAGKQKSRPIHLVKIPTYKDDYGDGYSGWHVDTGKPPKPLGAWWLRFWWDGRRGLQTEIKRAS